MKGDEQPTALRRMEAFAAPVRVGDHVLHCLPPDANVFGATHEPKVFEHVVLKRLAPAVSLAPVPQPLHGFVVQLEVGRSIPYIFQYLEIIRDQINLQYLFQFLVINL